MKLSLNDKRELETLLKTQCPEPTSGRCVTPAHKILRHILNDESNFQTASRPPTPVPEQARPDLRERARNAIANLSRSTADLSDDEWFERAADAVLREIAVPAPVPPVPSDTWTREEALEARAPVSEDRDAAAYQYAKAMILDSNEVKREMGRRTMNGFKDGWDAAHRSRSAPAEENCKHGRTACIECGGHFSQESVVCKKCGDTRFIKGWKNGLCPSCQIRTPG